jgi:hypothetical protein
MATVISNVCSAKINVHMAIEAVTKAVVIETKAETNMAALTPVISSALNLVTIAKSKVREAIKLNINNFNINANLVVAKAKFNLALANAKLAVIDVKTNKMTIKLLKAKSEVIKAYANAIKAKTVADVILAKEDAIKTRTEVNIIVTKIESMKVITKADRVFANNSIAFLLTVKSKVIEAEAKVIEANNIIDMANFNIEIIKVYIDNLVTKLNIGKANIINTKAIVNKALANLYKLSNHIKINSWLANSPLNTIIESEIDDTNI